MTPEDWRQYATKMTVFARLGETVLLQVEQGLLPEDAMERLGYRAWKSFVAYPKTACIWPIIRIGASDAFRNYVEGAQDTGTVDCSEYQIELQN